VSPLIEAPPNSKRKGKKRKKGKERKKKTRKKKESPARGLSGLLKPKHCRSQQKVLKVDVMMLLH
jgi:hypothetical protein